MGTEDEPGTPPQAPGRRREDRRPRTPRSCPRPAAGSVSGPRPPPGAVLVFLEWPCRAAQTPTPGLPALPAWRPPPGQAWPWLPRRRRGRVRPIQAASALAGRQAVPGAGGCLAPPLSPWPGCDARLWDPLPCPGDPSPGNPGPAPEWPAGAAWRRSERRGHAGLGPPGAPSPGAGWPGSGDKSSAGGALQGGPSLEEHRRSLHGRTVLGPCPHPQDPVP